MFTLFNFAEDIFRSMYWTFKRTENRLGLKFVRLEAWIEDYDPEKHPKEIMHGQVFRARAYTKGGERTYEFAYPILPTKKRPDKKPGHDVRRNQ